MTLSICIVTWNSMKFIAGCLESIYKQSIWYGKEEIKIAVNIVDNGSEDGTLDFVRKNYAQCHVLKNTRNLGFCRPLNQAIKMQKTDFVLIMNPDMILEKSFLEEIFKVIKRSSDKVGTFGPKILKAETVIDSGGLYEINKTDKIDSFGLEIRKSRQVKNIGEGEVDQGQYNKNEEMFGFSGACLLYRREALETVAYRDEFFDEDFFAYQDDFDMAYRLRLFGWGAVFAPRAKCYHFRSARASTLKPWQFVKIVRARREKSRIVNYHSYKNHFFALVKNEITENFWRHLPYIFWFELKKFVYLLFFEIRTLNSLSDFFRFLSRMRDKRKVIMSARKATAEEMREWFS